MTEILVTQTKPNQTKPNQTKPNQTTRNNNNNNNDNDNDNDDDNESMLDSMIPGNWKLWAIGILMIFSCLTLMLYHHQPPLTRLHPWKSTWYLKITHLQRKSILKKHLHSCLPCSFSEFVYFRTLRNLLKSASDEWSQFFDAIAMLYPKKVATEGGHDLRWWRPTSDGAMRCQQKQMREETWLLTVHPPNSTWNLEIFWFPSSESPFPRGPHFQVNYVCFGGMFFQT